MTLRRIAGQCLVSCAWFSVAACAHRPPNSSAAAANSASANARSTDGLIVTLSLAGSDAFDAAQRAVESQGFELDESTVKRLQFRTRPATIAGDTSMLLTAEIVPVSTTPPSSVVAVSATFSAPSGRIRNQRLVRVGGGADVLWKRLEGVTNALRGGREVK